MNKVVHRRTKTLGNLVGSMDKVGWFSSKELSIDEHGHGSTSPRPSPQSREGEKTN